MDNGLEDFLRDLDDLKCQFNNIEQSPMMETLKDFANEVVFTSQENIKEAGRFASGSLSQSIEPQFSKEETKYILSFIADYYWAFNDQGVNGIENNFGAPFSFKTLNPSKAMVDSFMGLDKQNWLASKGITSLNYVDKDGNYITKNLVTDADYRAGAYVLARGTKRKGIEPTYYLTSIFSEERMNKLSIDLGDKVVNLILK